MNAKPVIGILGGIGSGKSSVAEAFAGLGCAVINADKIALKILEQDEVAARIAAFFGREILDSQGRIIRANLAEKAFSSPEKLDILNGIIHPLVWEETEQLLARYLSDAAIPAVVLDIPLLMETGREGLCDVLVFVDCDEEKRHLRVAQKGRFGPDQIKKRENFQISLDKKREIAQYIVKNHSDLSDLTEQVARIYAAMIRVRG